MPLEPIGIITLLIVGAIAGWLAGKIVQGFGFGLIGNIVVGIIGALIGGVILGKLGIIIGAGMIAWIINAVIGAVILLVIIGLVRRATWRTLPAGAICVPAFCSAQWRLPRY